MKASNFQCMVLAEKRRLMQQSHENCKKFWSNPANRKKQSERVKASKQTEAKLA